MSIPTELDGIRYEQLQSEDLETCIDMVSHVFSNREGMVAQQRVTPEEFRLFAEAFTKKGMRDQLTLVARDLETGDLVGFLVADDFGGEPPEGLDLLTPKFNPILGMLDALVAWYLAHHLGQRGIAPAPGKICNLMMAGVLESHTRRRICLTATQLTLQLARDLGYKHAVGEFTSLGSAKVGFKAGLEELHAVKYSDFEYEGDHPFQALGPDTWCRLLATDL